MVEASVTGAGAPRWRSRSNCDASAVQVLAPGSACVSLRSAQPMAWRRVSPHALPVWAEQTLVALRGWASASGFYNRSSAAPAAGR